MRSIDEQHVALQCLQRAIEMAVHGEPTGHTVQRAESFYAFVTGASDADAKAKLALVREAVR